MTAAQRIETWQERYDRISKQWVRLGKLARRITNSGLGHAMGPLHKTSPYNRVHDTRQMKCRRCRLTVWVRLSGEITGLSTEVTCATMVARQARYR
jgi:hypothetical protein